MNRNEVVEAYELPTIYQTEEFKEAYRAINNLVLNKDRALDRLGVYGKTVNRRATSESAFPSAESGTES